MHCNENGTHMMSGYNATTESMIRLYHTPRISPNQCGSIVVQVVHAPIDLVWSLVRRFDTPQAYKQLVKSCTIREGDGGVGSVREVVVVSGMPAQTSVERLEQLDDEARVMVFSIIGGDHQLVNYRSTTTVHEVENGGGGGGEKTVVIIESYVVDVPCGSSKEDTVLFADTIVKCNLKWLACTAETLL